MKSQQKGDDKMNEMQIFNNEEFGDVRTVEENGQIWFCAADICKALGLTNPTMALLNLDEDERSKFDLGRQGETNFINESGLYTVILRSDKPNAKKFRKWVTGEVIPTIRRTGAYSLQKKASIREVIDLIRITRQTMQEQGVSPTEIAIAIKEIGEQHGIDFPEFFVKPEKTTLNDVMGMVDFVFEWKGKKKPTYEDFIIYRSSVKKIESGTNKK